MSAFKPTPNLRFTNLLQEKIQAVLLDKIPTLGQSPDDPGRLGMVTMGQTTVEGYAGVGFKAVKGTILLAASAALSEPQEGGWYSVRVEYSRVPLGEKLSPERMAQALKVCYTVSHHPDHSSLSELVDRIVRDMAEFFVNDRVGAPGNYQLKT